MPGNWLTAGAIAPEEDFRVVSIEEGGKAPFAGDLYSKQASVELILASEKCDRLVALEVGAADQLGEAKLIGEQAARKVEVDGLNAALDHERARRLDAERQRDEAFAAPAFWTRPEFVAPVSAVAGGVVVALAGAAAVWSVGQLRVAQ